MAKVDTNKCELKSSEAPIKVRTARGRLSYPNLFTPRDGKWSVSLLFPKTADLSALKEAIELAAKEKFGPDYAKKYPKLKRPILETGESPSIGADAEEFPVFIRTSTNAGEGRKAPQVVDHKMNIIGEDQQSEVYPGRWAMLSITVKGYDTDGNRGVTCYVNNVQLLEHDDQLGGGSRSASDDFEPIEISESADALFKGDAA